MPVDLPTREDYFQIGAQEILNRSRNRSPSLRITRQAIFTPGTDANILVASASAMAAEATRHLALRDAALFLDSAEGEDLDRLVADRFSPTVVRKQPSRAVVELQFRRPIPPSAGALITLDVGTKVRTADGVEFELTQPAVFPPNGSGPIGALAQAVLAGPSGNASANTITQFAAAPPDGAVVVTNPDIASGGSFRESDDSLRERARQFFAQARRGTLGAIEFGALTVQGVEAATAFEEVDASGDPTGVVRVYIADGNGQSNVTLAAAVRDALLEFRAAGVVVDVLTTAPVFESVSYAVAFVDGTDTVAAREQIKALTVATLNQLAPGEVLPRSLLFAIARTVSGTIVPDGAVLVPAGDIVPAQNEVIKTRRDLVAVNGV